jgi:hypothetical protein
LSEWDYTRPFRRTAVHAPRRVSSPIRQLSQSA